MTISTQSWWLRFSERAFSFSFVIFSFFMFSCWFPTGFSATFSTFAFLFALPLFFSRIEKVKFSLFEKAGLALFTWLLLSIFWSEAGILDSLHYLFEYRLYFMSPVLAVALLNLPNTQKRAICAALLGAVIALFTSYGLGLGWWKIEGAHLSLANHIYHGFIMSALLLHALLVSRHINGMFRFVAILVAVLTLYNVLNIENGRTGYLQIIAVCFIFVVLSFSRIQSGIMVLVAAVGLCFAYVSMDQFNARVDSTVASIENMIVNDDYKSSAGYRLEVYRGAIRMGVDNLAGGVGVGDVVSGLESLTNSGQIRVVTDNVHNEFLNMFLAGGMPALLLFLAFVLLIAWAGFQYRKINRVVGDALIGLSVIIFVSALFNSTIKDYGEKHALLIMLSLLSAKILADRSGSLKNTGIE